MIHAILSGEARAPVQKGRLTVGSGAFIPDRSGQPTLAPT